MLISAEAEEEDEDDMLILLDAYAITEKQLLLITKTVQKRERS